MTLSGQWLRNSASHRDPQYAQQPELDPEHEQRGSVDPNPNWEADPYQEVYPAGSYVGDEWVTVTPGLVSGKVVDHHGDGGHRDPSTVGEVATEVPLQFTSEAYRSDRFSGLGPEATAVSDEALKRGLNDEPLNNPPLAMYGGQGYRFGFVQQYWTNRDFAPPRRRHDWRVVTPPLAAKPNDQLPPAGGNPYLSPFPTLARAITNITRRPALREVPEPIAEADMAASVEPAEPEFGVPLGDWVAG